MSDRICIHEDCGEPYRSRGYCMTHYWQFKRAGAFAPKTLIDRFEEKIREAGDCWEWIGAKTSAGYGQKWNGQKVIPAHRWSYEYHVGPIPDGLHLDHLCRNRACVNPDHLDPVTNAENVKRGRAAELNGARLRARTCCPFGHLYTPENTYRAPASDARQCRTCNTARAKVRQSLRMGRTPVPTW